MIARAIAIAAIAFALTAMVLIVTGHADGAGRWQKATASVFDAGSEPELACRTIRGQYIVAHKSLPCGTKIKFCYRRCAWARVGDRGPYIAGRTWDLDTNLARAVGFPYGVGTINWRRGGGR